MQPSNGPAGDQDNQHAHHEEKSSESVREQLRVNRLAAIHQPGYSKTTPLEAEPIIPVVIMSGADAR